MSERVLRVFVNDLNTVRVKCEKCAAVAELSMSQVSVLHQHSCPGCRAELQTVQPLARLAECVEFLKKMQGFRIEFVLPDTSGTE